ncbi:hypothetical protein diail_4914, partial [Diaporthe ilicicola]
MAGIQLTVLTDEEKQAYIKADLCLISSPAKTGTIEGAITRWDELHYMHIVQSNVIHNVGAFLPFHRLYVRAHEILLQTECNYTGAQPYWDESSTAEDINAGIAFENHALFDPNTGFGGTGTGDDRCVTDGPFANLTLHMDRTANHAPYCLSRHFSPTYIQWGNSTYVDECFASSDYSEAWQCYNHKPHTTGHASIGGTMLDISVSPGDPLFFLHHANLDRLWWEWQQVNLTSRLTDMTGRNVPLASYLSSNALPYPSAAILDYDGDPGDMTTLNHNLWMVGIIRNATIAEVMNLGGDLICA